MKRVRQREKQIISITIILSLILLSGCATVTKGTSQEVTVTTDPAGAKCTLTREGTILAVIQPTPGSITIDKGKTNISVNCEQAGYKNTTGVFESKFADATMGNVLLGGVIGAAIDASSGAMHEYDPIVTLTMIPLGFATVSDRDSFFDKMRDDFIQGSEESMKLIADKCKPQRCDYEKKEAEVAKEARLAEIENERQTAKIGESVTSIAYVESKAAQSTAEPSIAFDSGLLTGTWVGTSQAGSTVTRDVVRMEIDSETAQRASGLLSYESGSCSPYQIEMIKAGTDKWNVTVESKPGCMMTGTLALNNRNVLKGRVSGSKFGFYKISLNRRDTQ